MFSIGDKVTIKRGKDKGEARVIAPADSDGNYVVRTSAGHHRVIKAEALAAPAESTIGEGRLAAEIQTAVSDFRDSPEANATLQALVSRLSGDMPGLGARISWPKEELASGH